MKKIFNYTARTLSVLIVAFFALFILEGFSPDFVWRDSVSHLILTLIVAIPAVIAFKKPKIGGGMFIILSLAFIIFFQIRNLISVIIPGIFAIIGFLFFIGNRDKTSDQNQICCPKFNPAPWDDKILEWNNKKFIKGKVFTLFFVPLNFGQAITDLITRAEKANAKTSDNLCLCDHTSKWNMNIYLAVDKEIPGAQNTVLNGKFFSKAYEGDFKDTGKWCQDFENLAKSKGLEINKYYMWYTTCPKCAKKYGKNYTVILGRTN